MIDPTGHEVDDDPGESDGVSSCPVCGSEMEWADCWHCLGEGGFHDCGEDCCCCAEPELDLNEVCCVCDGEGGYLECAALPHSDAQMEAYRKRGKT